MERIERWLEIHHGVKEFGAESIRSQIASALPSHWHIPATDDLTALIECVATWSRDRLLTVSINLWWCGRAGSCSIRQGCRISLGRNAWGKYSTTASHGTSAAGCDHKTDRPWEIIARAWLAAILWSNYLEKTGDKEWEELKRLISKRRS